MMLRTCILPGVLFMQHFGDWERSEYLGGAQDLPGCLRVTSRGPGQEGGFRDRVVTLWVVGPKLAGDVSCSPPASRTRSLLHPGQSLFPSPFWWYTRLLNRYNLFPIHPCAKN